MLTFTVCLFIFNLFIDLYKVCSSNTTENTHNDLFSTLEKESGSNINSNINSGETGAATGVASRPGSRNAQIIASKSNENYDKCILF